MKFKWRSCIRIHGRGILRRHVRRSIGRFTRPEVDDNDRRDYIHSRRRATDSGKKPRLPLRRALYRRTWVGLRSNSVIKEAKLTLLRYRVGFLVMIVPLYQAELVHPSIRGRVTALQQFMLGVGALAAAWISYGMPSPPPTSVAQFLWCS